LFARWFKHIVAFSLGLFDHKIPLANPAKASTRSTPSDPRWANGFNELLKAGGTSQEEFLAYTSTGCTITVWGIALNHKTSHDDDTSEWTLLAGPVCPGSRFTLS